MSKAGSAIKVMRTALKRVHKGWTKHAWSFRGTDGVTYVCLEGGVYGYCDENKHQPTEAQKRAIRVLKQIIFEKYGTYNIPDFNDDPNTTKEMVEEVIKLGIIRLETGGEEISDEEFDDLIEWKKEMES